MRTFLRLTSLALLLAFCVPDNASAQTDPPAQTARQALLEVVLAQNPDAVQKHVPNAARKTLFGDGDTRLPILRQLASFRQGIAMEGGKLETFDAGPVLLKVADEPAQREIEIIVERDDLAGDGDEIELSLHVYRQGQPEPMPIVPRLVLLLKQEKDIWKLDEITVALHMPLSDPDYVKGLQKITNSGFEASAIGAVQAINTAEISYSASFPERGYACKLAKLGGSATSQEPDPEHAMLIDDTMASGRRDGYYFSLRGCGTPPASRYRVEAVPVDPDTEMRAFCSDESGVVRYASDGKAATCLSEGLPLQ
ncbi:MAG TPA: hypothetical protein VNW47_04325 [Terriglobales bacterium]|nr:hypothetical protein [Terriglobales bacterium]